MSTFFQELLISEVGVRLFLLVLRVENKPGKYTLFFYKNIVSSVQAEYSYFSAHFSHLTLLHVPFIELY